MALVAVLDLTGRGTWWSWHLASMLARQDFEVTWVEADQAERTEMLLGPLPAREWQEGKVPGLAQLTPEVVPQDVVGHPTGLKFLPGCPPKANRPAGLDQALLAWSRGRSDWVIADLGDQHTAYPEVIRQSDLLVVVVAPQPPGPNRLRELGELFRGQPPEKRRYAVVEERVWREDRAFLRRRLPAIFRNTWQGASPALDLEPVADTEWCVGVAQWAQRQQDDGTPIFRLPPGQGEVPHAVVVQAKADWWRIAERVAQALGVPVEARVLEPLTEPPPEVVRFCVPESVAARLEGDRSRAPEIAIEEGGFLASPDDGWGIPGEQRPLDEVIKALDCALILGEPGIGKTYESKRWTHRVELTGAVDFRRELDELVAAGADTIALDAADEWTGSAAQLVDPLGRWLDRQARKPRLLLFGRSGDRMDALHAKLAGRYPEGRYARLTLLPLRAQDVEPLAARLLKASAAGLLDQIRALHLEALAARPLTLQMLARLWARGQELPGDRVKVYRDGLNALIEHAAGDLEQVMKVARPLAWVAILCGKSRFRFGEAEGELNLHDLQAAFKGLTRADIDAALRTPLFARSGATWSFAHRTYAEYLAATFAVAQNRRRRLMSLIEVEGMVPEPLSGFAGWLAALHPKVAEALIAADPGRLLAQRAYVPEEVRAQWLEALVGAVRAGQAHFGGQDLRVLLGPGVDEKARTLVRDEQPEVAANAVRLVALGGQPDSKEWLVAQARDQSLSSTVRSWAVYELATRRAVDGRLRAVLDEEPAEELRAELLSALWPDHLSAIELIRHLRPPHTDQAWKLRSFLQRHSTELIDRLRSEELPEVLEWAGRSPYFSQNGLSAQRWPFAGALIQRAWDLADEPTIAAALGRLLAAWFNHSASMRDLEQLDLDWWDPDLRRQCAVTGAFLAANPERFANGAWPLMGGRPLLPSVDQIIEQAELLADSDPELARRWLGLVRWSPWTQAQEMRIAALAHLSQLVVHELELRRRPPQSEAPAPSEPDEPPREPSLEERVAHFLELGKEEPDWWTHVSWLIDSLPESGDPSPQLGPEAQAEVTALAGRFLARPPVERPELIGHFMLQSAARFALRRSEPPAEPDKRLYWAATFMASCGPEAADPGVRGFVESAGSGRDEAARLAWDHAPAAAHDIVRWVEWSDAWANRAQARLEESLPEAPTGKPKSDDERRQANQLEQARMNLAHNQEHLFKALLQLPAASERFWTWGVGRLGADWVVRGLFERDASRAWAELLGRFLTDDEAARSIALAIAGQPAWWTLDHEACASVYLRLHRLFDPPGRSPNSRIRPIDKVMDLKPALLRGLVQAGAVEQLARLEAEVGGLGGLILDARRARARLSWQPLSIRDAAHFERRLRTSADLLDRVDEAFEEIDKDLNGELAAWEAFFDRAHERQDKRVWPKHETTACTLLADRLRSKLSDLSFKALNVEPQEVDGQDRIDIKLEVPGEEGHPLTLKVEVKWATNTDKEKGVEVAMERQLVDRYLNHPHDLAGLYLVLWPGPLTGMGADVPARWRNDWEPLDKLLQDQVAQLQAKHPHVALRARVLRLGARCSSR